jgi:hypothetical protein
MSKASASPIPDAPRAHRQPKRQWASQLQEFWRRALDTRGTDTVVGRAWADDVCVTSDPAPTLRRTASAACEDPIDRFVERSGQDCRSRRVQGQEGDSAMTEAISSGHDGFADQSGTRATYCACAVVRRGRVQATSMQRHVCRVDLEGAHLCTVTARARWRHAPRQ